MKRFLEWLWETITTILLIVILAASMFPFWLYWFCTKLFN